MEKLTMSVKQMAELVGTSLPTAYDMTEIEGFPVIRIGKRKLIPKKEFLEWFSQQAGKQLKEV